jgi:transposase
MQSAMRFWVKNSRFVRQRLCPWLCPGDVVLMDNLGAHKIQGVRQAIEARGACVVYLPAYSPDFNPIELWWADLKRQVRKLGPRVVDELAGWCDSCAARHSSRSSPPGSATAPPSLNSTDLGAKRPLTILGRPIFPVASGALSPQRREVPAVSRRILPPETGFNQGERAASHVLPFENRDQAFSWGHSDCDLALPENSSATSEGA